MLVSMLLLTAWACETEAYASRGLLPTASVSRAAHPLASASSEHSLSALIASKKAVIAAHNADVAASMKFFGKTLREKEVRKLDDLPGGDNKVLDGTLPGDWGWDPLR